MTDTNQLIGPDPARLTDSEIEDVSRRLVALGQRVAGQPGVSVTAEDRLDIDPGNLFLFEALEVLNTLLMLESERRLRTNPGELFAEIDAWLADPESGAQ